LVALHVKAAGATGMFRLETTGGAAGAHLNYEDSYDATGRIGFRGWVNSNDYNVTNDVGNIGFTVGSATRQTLFANGHVSIGTTDAGAMFNVLSASPTVGGSFQTTGGATNLLINNSQACSYVVFTVGGTTVGSITTNGTTTAYVTTSDARLKTNIAEAEDPGALIDAIEVIQHDWIEGDGDHVRYGLLAQDVHAIFPEAIHVGSDELTEAREAIEPVDEVPWVEAVLNDDGEIVTPAIPGKPAQPGMTGQEGGKLADPWGVDYAKLVPLLIAEVQGLRARVAALEAA
jgi:hypothetical protein